MVPPDAARGEGQLLQRDRVGRRREQHLFTAGGVKRRSHQIEPRRRRKQRRVDCNLQTRGRARGWRCRGRQAPARTRCEAGAAAGARGRRCVAV